MPVCLTHSQRYDVGEWCPYCGRPMTVTASGVPTPLGVWQRTTVGDGWEINIPAGVPPLTADEIEDGAAVTMRKCPDCTTTYPIEARHTCNMRAVELPEIKDDDIPDHERI